MSARLFCALEAIPGARRWIERPDSTHAPERLLIEPSLYACAQRKCALGEQVIGRAGPLAVEASFPTRNWQRNRLGPGRWTGALGFFKQGGRGAVKGCGWRRNTRPGWLVKRVRERSNGKGQVG